MESGSRGVQVEDAAGLIHAYGFRGQELAAFAGMLADSRRDWWDAAPQVMTGAFSVYALLELAASRIVAYHPAGVPGLLQAPAYARAAARRQPGMPAGGEKAAAAAAAWRQAAVLGGPAAPFLDVIIGAPAPGWKRPGAEAAGLRPAGPGARVRFLPAAETRLAGAGPFSVLEFDSGPVPAFVYQPGPSGGFLTADQDSVRSYADLFAALGRRAAASHRQAQAPPQARPKPGRPPQPPGSGIEAWP